MKMKNLNDPLLPAKIRSAHPRWVVCLVMALGILSIPLTPRIVRSQVGMMSVEDETLDVKRQSLIIDSVAVALDSNYVFPDVAKKMGKYLREQKKKGAYKDLTSAQSFTEALTRDVRKINNDRHLAVRFLSTFPAYLNDPDSMSREDLERRIRNEASQNFGFQKLERLEGNVGYLDLRGFNDARWAGATAVAAMNVLANSDALIIDLRKNGGGESSMIQLLASYLLDGSKHINSFYYRDRNKTEQSWTQAYVPGKKMGDIPVYVLTSSFTFSAAEEFTYDLKCLKRATIVGETTGGGAHPVMGVYFKSLKVGVQVPIARAVNPVTQTNWEGTGIAPDIAVPQEKALETAHREALKKILEKTKDEEQRKRLAWSLAALEARLNPVRLDPERLKQYPGKYGPRTITLENGALYYQREGRPKYKMIPMSQGTFMFDDLGYFHLQFICDATGKPTEVVGLYDDGHTDRDLRTEPEGGGKK
jgi:retinol-binding protein 3